MSSKRINFKTMNCDDFIAYLEDNSVLFEPSKHVTADALEVIKVRPIHYRLVSRFFNHKTGKQVFDVISEKSTNIQLVEFISTVNDKIENMATKGVYKPRRLQPKWQSLDSDEEKLELFRKYMKAPTSSIGFLRLIDVNLPSKTLESIIIEYPEFEPLIGIDGLRQKCIDKFKRYQNGKDYLHQKQVL